MERGRSTNANEKMIDERSGRFSSETQDWLGWLGVAESFSFHFGTVAAFLAYSFVYRCVGQWGSI